MYQKHFILKYGSSLIQKVIYEYAIYQHMDLYITQELYFVDKYTFCDYIDGMILYNGQTSNGNGDFVSVNLVNGRVQYCYDLGSGVANLTSGGESNLVQESPTKYPISLSEWHSVKITRNGPHGTLQVDEGPIVSGSSPHSLTELNLATSLFLGGFR